MPWFADTVDRNVHFQGESQCKAQMAIPQALQIQGKEIAFIFQTSG